MIKEILSYLNIHSIDLLMALIIGTLGFLLAFIIKKALNNAIKKRAHDKTTKFFLANLIYTLILIIVSIMVLNKLGIPTTSLIAVLGASSLAIALALKDSLSNVASGIILILVKPFKIGDNIDISGTVGDVIEITLYNTTLKMLNNDMVFIPNGKITSDRVINHTTQSTRRLLLECYVDSASPLEQVESILLNIINADPRALTKPQSSVIVSQIDSTGVLMNAIVWTNKTNFSSLRTDLLTKIITELHKNNIKLPTISNN